MSITYPIIKITTSGQVLEFSGDQIIEASLIEQVNLISEEIPINEVEFKVFSDSGDFSMFGGEYYELLSDRLPVEVYESIDGSPVFLGKFYLSEWENPSEYEFRFRAIDIIGVLAHTDYDGRFYSTATSLSDVLADLFNPIDVLYTLDPDIVDTEVKGWIPPGTYREALQQICFVSDAVPTTSRSSNLLISKRRIPAGLFDTKILDDEKFQGQVVKLNPLVTSVELVSHTYDIGGELEDIFAEDLEIGTHKITFNKPYYELVITGPGYIQSVLGTEDGDYLVTEDELNYLEVGGEYVFGPNSVYLELSEAGTVTITGYPWLDSQRSHFFVETVINEYSNKNTIKIDEVALVNITNAQTVLNGLRDYFRLRYFCTIKILPSTIKMGDLVYIKAFGGHKIVGSVTKLVMNLTGGFIIDLEMTSTEVVYIQPVEFPVRRPRTGVAECGVGEIRQNMFRRYTHE